MAHGWPLTLLPSLDAAMAPVEAAFLQRAQVEAVEVGVLAVERPDAPELPVAVVEQVRLPLDALRIGRQRTRPRVCESLWCAPVLKVVAGGPYIDLARFALQVSFRVRTPDAMEPPVEPLHRRHVVVSVVSLRQLALVNGGVFHLRLVEVVCPHRQRRKQQGGEEGRVRVGFMVEPFVFISEVHFAVGSVLRAGMMAVAAGAVGKESRQSQTKLVRRATSSGRAAARFRAARSAARSKSAVRPRPRTGAASSRPCTASAGRPVGTPSDCASPFPEDSRRAALRPPEEGRQQVLAVTLEVVGKRDPGGGAKGWQKIDRGEDGGGVDRTGRRAARPAHEQRDTDTSLEEFALASGEAGGCPRYTSGPTDVRAEALNHQVDSGTGARGPLSLHENTTAACCAEPGEQRAG